MIGVLLKHGASVLCLLAGRSEDLGPICLHDQPAEGLLIIGYPNHVDSAFHVEMSAGQGEGGTPLPRTRLRGKVLYPFLHVIICLGNGRVRLMGACGREVLPFEVDLCRGLQERLQPPSSLQWRRTPEHEIGIANLFRYRNATVSGGLLVPRGLGEDALPIIERHWLLGARVKVRGNRLGQIGRNVVPVLGYLFVGQVYPIIGAYGHEDLETLRNI
ncbi:MAG: hypothetical protein A4E31_00345 [Methanomassiliicoccales archaeon PtaU1.Bin030]|nr:MAG: hypothetical protein A4E31_00345 [Methanomassiliicoccales archaeon PtaU1.Bin030]